MIHKATEKFWQEFYSLPKEVKILANKNFALLKSNPNHPSLQFKKLGKLWSVRVGSGYRGLALLQGNVYFWIWIGSHAEYDKKIK